MRDSERVRAWLRKHGFEECSTSRFVQGEEEQWENWELARDPEVVMGFWPHPGEPRTVRYCFWFRTHAGEDAIPVSSLEELESELITQLLAS
jgi:hypothetical protein